MNSYVNILFKLMRMELKWIVKEEIVFGDFFNFLAWMLESNKVFFKLFLEVFCNMELF